MYHEARDHVRKRGVPLQPSFRTDGCWHCRAFHPLRDHVRTIAAHSKTLAFRVIRHQLLFRLLIVSFFAVVFGWVIGFRLVSQQSYALPGSGVVSSSSPPLLLWREFNPSSPPASASATSACTAALHPLVGEWSGSCEQLLGINIVNQPVCSSTPCSRPFDLSYSASGFTRRYSAGLSETSSTCSSAVPLIANALEVIEVSSSFKYMKNDAAKSAWFHGNPHSVTGPYPSLLKP
jgi:hypothetical protein